MGWPLNELFSMTRSLIVNCPFFDYLVENKGVSINERPF